MKTLLTGEGDSGAKKENVVFIDFLRRGQSCGYFADSLREVDFCFGSFQLPQAMEAKFVDQFDWEDKRYAGIKCFLKKYPQTSSITIVSKSVEMEINKGSLTIRIIPAWKYLLNKEK